MVDGAGGARGYVVGCHIGHVAYSLSGLSVYVTVYILLHQAVKKESFPTLVTFPMVICVFGPWHPGVGLAG